MNVAVPFPTAIARTLAEVLKGDPGAVVLVEGAGPVADELCAAFPERVIALPIADRAMLGVAVGLAWAGRKVIVEVAATGRLPALAEALADAGVAREGFGASIVLRVPWGGEAGPVDGAALELLAAVPGLTVVCPRDASRAAGLLTAAVAAGGPVVVLEPRALLRSTGAPEAAALRTAQTLREGDDVTLVAFGSGVQVALAAADALVDEGVQATVVDLVALAPLDAAGLATAVERTGRLVVVAPQAEAGLAARVRQVAVDGAFWSLEAPPRSAPPQVGSVVEAALAVREA